MSQWKRILNYLLLGNEITPLECLEIKGGFRLSERIREIEAKNFKIERGWHVTSEGAKVRKYWLAKDQIIQTELQFDGFERVA